jgi:pimeloyl-ACP methyl ester carboxylesterase
MIPAAESFAGTFPFAPHFSDASGFRMHYVDEGEGEPIVCLHGEPTWGYVYRKFVGPLSKKYRVIVPDHMGFGKSETPLDREYTLRTHVENLEALLLSLDLKDITLVMQDWGGPIGAGFALRNIGRVRRLCLFNTLVPCRLPEEALLFPRLFQSDWFRWIATANPVEYEGTYPLPEAQLDRFLLRIEFGYPDAEEEWDVLQRRLARRQEAQTLRRIVDPAELSAMQAAVENGTVDPDIGRYCVGLATATREHHQTLVGSSPRGGLALMLVARAYAAIAGRDFVTPEDVKAVAVPALAHRITIRPELWMSDITGATVVRQVLNRVPTPTATGPR